MCFKKGMVSVKDGVYVGWEKIDVIFVEVDNIMGIGFYFFFGYWVSCQFMIVFECFGNLLFDG